MTTETISVCGTNDTTPATTDKARARSANGSAPGIGGMLWFAGWLFTIGFAKLVWWQALLALPLWPYFLGAQIR